MPRFIKFIAAGNMLVIINTDSIDEITFLKELKKICIMSRNDRIMDYNFLNLEDFKIQCDAIMQQLGL